MFVNRMTSYLNFLIKVLIATLLLIYLIRFSQRSRFDSFLDALVASVANNEEYIRSTDDQTSFFDNISKISLKGTSDRVNIRSYGGNRLKIEQKVIHTNKDDIPRIDIKNKCENGTLSIQIEHPFFFNGPSAHYTILLPKNQAINLDISLTSGSFSINHGNSNLDINTTSGAVNIKNHTGNIKVKTKSGIVQILNYLSGAHATLQTKNGSISYPRSLRSTLLDENKKEWSVIGRKKRKTIQGYIGNGKHTIIVNTSSGNIALTDSLHLN